jgi:hypothetical protein
MTIPPEILELAEQLRKELDGIEKQANEGLAIATHLLDHFPNNASLIILFSNLGNIIFFVSGFRQRIESLTQKIHRNSTSIEAVQEVVEELSEMWGRMLECKMTVHRSVDHLRALQ